MKKDKVENDDLLDKLYFKNLQRKEVANISNDDLKKLNSKYKQVALRSGKISKHIGDQVRNTSHKLSNRKLSKKHSSHRINGKNKSMSSRFILESIMPHGAPNLMDINDQDDISKEYYETSLQTLKERLKKVDKGDYFIIIHENDKLCKEYHRLRTELDDLEEKLHKIKEQISHISNVRNMSGDDSINIQNNLSDEQKELEEIEHRIESKRSNIKKIQKYIRKLDENDYDLQNFKHIIYNGMRKLISHWLSQNQNNLDQETDFERQVELQNEIEKANEQMTHIDADINKMYLSYNSRKRKRMLTDFDYENFCEYSTFTECLYRYDTPPEDNNDNDNISSVITVEVISEEDN